MKRLALAAAIACALTAPAVAFDADPASFRANPQAWVRNTLAPGCKAPTDPETVAQCDCMVPLLATRITEADVARVNEPDFKQRTLKVVMGAGMLCMPRK
jgi:hypothetical protein